MNLEDIFRGDITNMKWRDLGEYLKRSRIVGGIGVRVSRDITGTIISSKQTRSIGVGSSSCPFGEIVTYKVGNTMTTGIRGGSLYAGSNVWNVANKDLNLEASGTYKVWLSISVEANFEDGVLTPGINTSSAPEWNQGAASGAYPSQTIPTTDEVTGTAIVALGILTIADGAASFEPESCGPIMINHCPGTLGNSRIGSA